METIITKNLSKNSYPDIIPNINNLISNTTLKSQVIENIRHFKESPITVLQLVTNTSRDNRKDQKKASTTPIEEIKQKKNTKMIYIRYRNIKIRMTKVLNKIQNYMEKQNEILG